MFEVIETILGMSADSDGDVVTRMLSMLESGGPVVLILIAMSVIAMTIALIKLWQFRQVRLADRRTAQTALQIWQDGDPSQALAVAEQSANPTAQALARAMRGQMRRLPEARVREEVTRFGNDVIDGLRSWLRPLEVIASLAPLLGLFGTVLGMIDAFQSLEAAGNQVNPSILSGGIWEALLTTAVGLAVAIPTVAILNWLEGSVDRVAADMENTTTALFTVNLSREAGLQVTAPTHDMRATPVHE